MSELKRIIVVDNGDREPEAALSAELAELGYASITTSVEAAPDVFAAMAEPDAVLLHIADHNDARTDAAFAAFADRLERAHPHIPVIRLDGARDSLGGSHLATLQSRIGLATTAVTPAKPPRL
ncbi:MAG: hypothetical protein JJU21_08685 [Salinarimonas sp.]|nr:hypothetical protein [Salinarimonas sp.]